MSRVLLWNETQNKTRKNTRPGELDGVYSQPLERQRWITKITVRCQHGQKIRETPGVVVHDNDPSHSGGRSQEDCHPGSPRKKTGEISKDVMRTWLK